MKFISAAKRKAHQKRHAGEMHECLLLYRAGRQNEIWLSNLTLMFSGVHQADCSLVLPLTCHHFSLGDTGLLCLKLMVLQQL